MRSPELCHTSFTKIDISSQFENICVLKKSSARLDRLRVAPLAKILVRSLIFILKFFNELKSFEPLNFNNLSNPPNSYEDGLYEKSFFLLAYVMEKSTEMGAVPQWFD